MCEEERDDSRWEPIQFKECPACGGQMFLFGILGYLYWFRCTNCGIEASEDHRE